MLLTGQKAAFAQSVICDICYCLVRKYFKNQMLNTTKTSVSNCCVYFVSINKAGRIHKLELICIFTRVICIASSTDWIVESGVLPATVEHGWGLSLFHLKPISFPISMNTDTLHLSFPPRLLARPQN